MQATLGPGSYNGFFVAHSFTHSTGRNMGQMLAMFSKKESVQRVVPTNLGEGRSDGIGENEIMSSSVPDSQYHLYRLHKKLAASHIDQCGNARLSPCANLWFSPREILPRFDASGNVVSIGEGMVDPKTKIFIGECTSVFQLVDDPDKVIKYHFHEEVPNPCMVDPTVVDYWFLRHLESTDICDIVPKIYYLSDVFSPTEVMGEVKRLMEKGRIGKTLTFKCEKASHVPKIRFSIMEKVGVCVHKYIVSQPDRRATFANAIWMGGQMIALAEKLHSHDFVHGDAHMGNFAFRGNKIVMLDFGRARRIFEDEQLESCFKVSRRFWVSPWISPWEMQKYSYTYRDDVYRIVLGMAFCIHGDQYNKFMDVMHDWKNYPEEHFEVMWNAAIDFKKTGNIFEIPPMDTPYKCPDNVITSFTLEGRVPDAVLADVRRLLAEILALVMNVGFFSKPDYAAIKGRLAEILNLVEGNTDTLASIDEAFEMPLERLMVEHQVFLIRVDFMHERSGLAIVSTIRSLF